jgi:hypothetical protein
MAAAFNPRGYARQSARNSSPPCAPASPPVSSSPKTTLFWPVATPRKPASALAEHISRLSSDIDGPPGHMNAPLKPGRPLRGLVTSKRTAVLRPGTARPEITITAQHTRRHAERKLNELDAQPMAQRVLTPPLSRILLVRLIILAPLRHGYHRIP